MRTPGIGRDAALHADTNELTERCVRVKRVSFPRTWSPPMRRMQFAQDWRPLLIACVQSVGGSVTVWRVLNTSQTGAHEGGAVGRFGDCLVMKAAVATLVPVPRRSKGMETSPARLK